MKRTDPGLLSWALLLLLAVLLLHYGVDHIAQLWPDPMQARRALFYIGQGMKGCVLWAALWWLLPRGRASLPLAAVCGFGFFQDATLAGCRLAYGIERVPSPGLWNGVCDELSGPPMYLIGLAVGLLAACVCDQGAKKK